ncbi:MAG: OmpH family outer membrane protein [Bacteroidetes bacterium]|nr:OmpH family outer membrane protein [Bacteroidota bacterium]
MKSIQTYLNIALGIAVAVLFFLHFKGAEGNGKAIGASLTDSLSNPGQGLKIAYVNGDSMMSSYGLMKDLEAKFIQDNMVRESKLKSAQTKLEQQYRNYQNEVSTLTARERGKKEEQLQLAQQQLMADQQELSQNAAMQEAEMYEQIQDSLQAFFKEFGKELGVDYVLATQKGSGILFTNPSLDVTGPAIERLNQRYQAGKAK